MLDAPPGDRRYHLYILRCVDGTFYTGIAIDVGARIAQHESGRRGARYLRGRAPFELAFSCEAGDRSSASRLEYRVKQLPRSSKEKLVSGEMSIEQLV